MHIVHEMFEGEEIFHLLSYLLAAEVTSFEDAERLLEPLTVREDGNGSISSYLKIVVDETTIDALYLKDGITGQQVMYVSARMAN